MPITGVLMELTHQELHLSVRIQEYSPFQLAGLGKAGMDISKQFPGYRKKYLRWLDAIIPDVGYERGMPCTDFMMFLDTRPTLSGKEGDVFFVKNHIQDGKVYWIHDADITGMRELSDPVTAIDLYCAHVLSGKPGRFDFREFSRPL
ncbi:hypothetical protein [Pseudomonas sp. KNUC1026]|uniref:hypothetical protein n=1 Tax=Pseudomonas sp. KNUC1026 TaxID=2893890 RepID=UPI001F1F4B2F|nr:hypothetical protein [Pseudomonas sp. KNUC1026]UFH50132.1 hypothetical protein LN139_01950 [Pseudomonas sp. KNUC1026]